jgi:hypothetical protein
MRRRVLITVVEQYEVTVESETDADAVLQAEEARTQHPETLTFVGLVSVTYEPEPKWG